jgi:hypothetical protein
MHRDWLSETVRMGWFSVLVEALEYAMGFSAALFGVPRRAIVQYP